MMRWKVKKEMPSGSLMSSVGSVVWSKGKGEIGEKEVGVLEQRQHGEIVRTITSGERADLPFDAAIGDRGKLVDRD